MAALWQPMKIVFAVELMHTIVHDIDNPQHLGQRLNRLGYV